MDIRHTQRFASVQGRQSLPEVITLISLRDITGSRVLLHYQTPYFFNLITRHPTFSSFHYQTPYFFITRRIPFHSITRHPAILLPLLF